MPTYQYKCTGCNYEFEEFQKISDPPEAYCPKCGDKVERIITGGVGFVLKGGGFYSTEHRTASYKDGEKQEKNAVPGVIKDDKKTSSDSGKKNKKE
jgi:putative FmdB family regulatory protein